MIEQDDEAIRSRAHALWEVEGRPERNAEQHWARALHEREHAHKDNKPNIGTKAAVAGDDLIPGGARRNS